MNTEDVAKLAEANKLWETAWEKLANSGLFPNGINPHAFHKGFVEGFTTGYTKGQEGACRVKTYTIDEVWNEYYKDPDYFTKSYSQFAKENGWQMIKESEHPQPAPVEVRDVAVSFAQWCYDTRNEFVDLENDFKTWFLNIYNKQ